MSNNINDYTGTILWDKENATVSIWQVGEEYKTSVTVDEVKKLVKTQDVTFEVHTNDGFGKTGTFSINDDEIILSVVIGENINQFSINSNGVELVPSSDDGDEDSSNIAIVTVIYDETTDPVCEFKPKDLLLDGLNLLIFKVYENGVYTGNNMYHILGSYTKSGDIYSIATDDGTYEFYADSYDSVFAVPVGD